MGPMTQQVLAAAGLGARPPRRSGSRAGGCPGVACKPQQKALARPQSAPGRRSATARSSSREKDLACKAEGAVSKKAAEVRRALQTPVPATAPLLAAKEREVAKEVAKELPTAPEVARRRQVRPPSAKGTKHRRVVDDDLECIIYEDLEEVSEDVSRHWESFGDLPPGSAPVDIVVSAASPQHTPGRCVRSNPSPGQGAGAEPVAPSQAAAPRAAAPKRPTSAALGGRGSRCTAGSRAVSARAHSRSSSELRASAEELRASLEDLDLGTVSTLDVLSGEHPDAGCEELTAEVASSTLDVSELQCGAEDLVTTPTRAKERRSASMTIARPPKPRLRWS
mmetsp:Transcript_89499/g.208434  ORF Transcript_89499/g.208434 Transcript_89499/m.208434 type:complete len:337 (+) Transcript_89499:110-1120(+)